MERQLATHCGPWPISRRAHGPPRNLTFAHAGGKARDGDSACSPVATIKRQEVLAERLHPKAANSPFRPTADIALTDLASAKLPLNLAPHDLEPRHRQVCGAVAPRRLQLQLHRAGGVKLHPFRGKRGAGDLAA